MGGIGENRRGAAMAGAVRKNPRFGGDNFRSISVYFLQFVADSSMKLSKLKMKMKCSIECYYEIICYLQAVDHLALVRIPAFSFNIL